MFNSNSLAISSNEPDLKAASNVGNNADSNMRFLIYGGASQSLDLMTCLRILTILAA